MKAILLSAGKGSRLGFVGKKIPKALLKIKSKTILEIWIEKMISIGVSEVIINTHHLKEKIEKYLDKKKFPIKITLANEPNLLGTGGTLKKNLKLIKNNTTFLIHTDNFNLENLKNFLNFHTLRTKKFLFSMMLFYTDRPKTCGIASIDKEGKLVSFIEKPKKPQSNLANTAIYILSPKFINEFEKKFKYKKYIDFSNDVIPLYIKKIKCYVSKKNNIDIGSIYGLKKARNISKN